MARLSLGERKLSAKLLYVGTSAASCDQTFARLAERPDARGPIRETRAGDHTISELDIAPTSFGKVQGCDLVFTLARLQLEQSSPDDLGPLLQGADGVVLMLDADAAPGKTHDELVSRVRTAVSSRRPSCPVVVQWNHHGDAVVSGLPNRAKVDWIVTDARPEHGEGVSETLEAATRAIVEELRGEHRNAARGELTSSPQFPPSVQQALERKRAANLLEPQAAAKPQSDPLLREELQLLREQNESHREALTALVESTSGATLERWAQLDKRLSGLATASGTALERWAELEERLTGLAASSGATLDKWAELDARLEALSNRTAGLESKVEETADTTARTEAEVSTTKDQLVKITAATQEIRPVLTSATASLRQSLEPLTHIGRLADTSTEVATQLDDLQSRVESLSNRVETANRTSTDGSDQSRAQLDKLTLAIAGVAKHLDEHTQKQAQLARQLDAILTLGRATDLRFKALEGQLDDLSSAAVRQAEAFAGVGDRVGALETKLEQQTAAIKRHEPALKNATAQLEQSLAGPLGDLHAATAQLIVTSTATHDQLGAYVDAQAKKKGWFG